MLHKQGFTLIELLVVVLIIGVLAAVALPQYNYAVEKARASEALTIVNSLQKAIDLYVLEHGYETTEFIGTANPDNPYANNLDIDAEGLLICDQMNGDKCRTEHVAFDAFCDSGTKQCYIFAYRKKDGNMNNPEQYTLFAQKPASTGIWQKKCLPNFDSNRAVFPYADKLCKDLQSQGWGYKVFK